LNVFEGIAIAGYNPRKQFYKFWWEASRSAEGGMGLPAGRQG